MTVHKPTDRHDWVGAIVTVTDDVFDIAAPSAEQVDVDVVAHSLALQCRFNGHIPGFYSVAEHSVRVSRWLEAHDEPVAIQQAGLWHDGAEAYIGDMVRPMKQMEPLGSAYLEVEDGVAEALSHVVGVDLVNLPDIVKAADKAVYEWEVQNIRSGHLSGWGWSFAREAFLRRHEMLFDETISRFWRTPVSPRVGQ